MASSSSRLFQRCRLLDAARGLLSTINDGTTNTTSGAAAVTSNRTNRLEKRPLPTFSLSRKHFGNQLLTSSADKSSQPQVFHQLLCDLIRNAKQRISIASLYIGPAASPKVQQEEVELLNALAEQAKREDISIQVVLDQNRALRPVPLTQDQVTTTTFTSSAKAVSQALYDRPLYLFQVLPYPFSKYLPNPYNEVAGVFHIKLYIIDDNLLLSGANLSQEYFVDRQDRYLWITNGGNGLVDFYHQLVNLLCNHSYKYNCTINDEETITTPNLSRNGFIQQLTKHYDNNNNDMIPAQDLLTTSITSTEIKHVNKDDDDDKVVAVAIPTFFAPLSFFENEEPEFVSDIDATLNLLQEASLHHDTLQLSSAYLNPTKDLMNVFKQYQHVQLLTAGQISHGFRPKKKQHTNTGNKGKDWIPTVFDHLTQDAIKELTKSSSLTTGTATATTTSTSAIHTATSSLSSSSSSNIQLYHWEKQDWTFHAKGIWLREENENGQQEVAAAIFGSSNFGERSFCRDMESNLILVFPPYDEDDDTTKTEPMSEDVSVCSNSNSIADSFGRDWDQLMSSSTLVSDPKNDAPPLPWYIRMIFPFIKTFF